MKFHSSIAMTVAGAAFLAFAVAPPAFAKRIKDSGTATVECLKGDTALQGALGITDGSEPVTVTLAPTSLWPPNHKMRTEALSVNLKQPWDATNAPGTAYDNGDGTYSADITVWLVEMTDDQYPDDGPDASGGHGCGKKYAKQGEDWSPATLSLDDPSTYVSGSATLSDMTVTPLSFFDQSSDSVNVGLRAERCARDGTRTYTIGVVCCDTTDSTSIVCDDSSLVPPPPNQPAPQPTAATNFEELSVEVLKHRLPHHHHGKP